MTPILLFFVTLTAARAPGKITPTTGIGKAALISSNDDSRRGITCDY